MKLRVFIADDHAVLRSGLRLLINEQPDMEVVGEASDGVAAQQRIPETAPDVALIDLSMPPRDGLEVIRHVTAACPTARVLVLTMHDDAGYLRMALAAGAAGYVVKTAVDGELLSAIRAVAQGRTFVDLACRPAEVLQDRDVPSPSRTPRTPPAVLSSREREVLNHVARGFTNQQIAERLSLSTKTVETYRARLMEKLALRSRADLVRYALDQGILTSEAGTEG
jgi:two-component system response regulator NreC